MTVTLFHPFSKRHDRALRERKLRPSLPKRLRRRVWHILSEFNYSYYYQPDPNDRWNTETTALVELPRKLLKLYGTEGLEAYVDDERKPVDLEGFVVGAYPSQVFDCVEMFFQELQGQRSELQSEINQAFQEENCPWVFCDGYFLQINSQFLQEQVLSRAHELMAVAGFEGALQEFIDARNDLVTEDFKGAIHNAAKAFESTLKTIESRQDGNAKELVNGLKETKFYTSFPDQLVPSFGDNVLMTLPFIRNQIGGHGQGTDIIAVPRSLAQMSVNLAGTFIVFLVSRWMELNPKVEERPQSQLSADSDIPF